MLVSPRSFHNSGTFLPCMRGVRSYATKSLKPAIQALDEPGPSSNLYFSDFVGSQLFFFVIFAEGDVLARIVGLAAAGGMSRFGVCGRLLLPSRLCRLLFLLSGLLSGPLW
jgi:hypothetical protein